MLPKVIDISYKDHITNGDFRKILWCTSYHGQEIKTLGLLALILGLWALQRRSVRYSERRRRAEKTILYSRPGCTFLLNMGSSDQDQLKKDCYKIICDTPVTLQTYLLD